MTKDSPGGFENRALSGLSKLRGQLPPGEPPPEAAPPEPEAEPLFPDKLVVRRERKDRKGKTVTCIVGVPSEKRVEVARTLARKLGCGGTVQGDELVLQGDHVRRAAAWLRTQGARRVVEGN